MKEIRMVLNETTFTHLCKNGYIRHQSSSSGINNVNFTKSDIKTLCDGEIVEKKVDDDILKFALQDLGLDYIREIVKRSPIYSEVAIEF